MPPAGLSCCYTIDFEARLDANIEFGGGDITLDLEISNLWDVFCMRAEVRLPFGIALISKGIYDWIVGKRTTDVEPCPFLLSA